MFKAGRQIKILFKINGASIQIWVSTINNISSDKNFRSTNKNPLVL